MQFKTREKSAIDMEITFGSTKVKGWPTCVLEKDAFPNGCFVYKAEFINT